MKLSGAAWSVLPYLGLVFQLIQSSGANNILTAGIFQITPNNEENALGMNIVSENGVLVTGKLGMGLPGSVGEWEPCTDPDYECYQWGDFAKVYFKEERDALGSCSSVQWTSTYARELEDCYDIQEGVNWYGGGQTYPQYWTVEKVSRTDAVYVPGDWGNAYAGTVEKYWLTSNGAAIFLDTDTPLFVSVNSTRPNRFCFTARDREPYVERNPLTLNYHWCVADNVKEVHLAAISNYLGKPTGLPDETMLIQPLWSTWAEYKVDVNQSIVLDFARRVISEGFVNSSHIEIDDNWESCYGQVEFDPEKFPDPKAMIEEIRGLNLRTTIWTHPFVNYDCPLFDEGFRKEYFVKDAKPRTAITWWWQGHDSGIIDITNPEAEEWFINRLRKLQQDFGIDSFKFDAGDPLNLPSQARFNPETDRTLWPNLYTTKFVETCAKFGGLIETRVAVRNQELPIFIRMTDKGSNWGHDNGLRSMIPVLLLMSIAGYPFVLPDMIGGNNLPTKELYIRWMQANIFMPSVQFSNVPWKYDQETVSICLNVLAQREKYKDLIMAAAKQAVEDGSPINRPMWWVDPKDPVTFPIDDAYMLGDTILVAPVVQEGATSRDIYLPEGSWTSAQDGQVHQGPTWLRNYPAPLNVVPYFLKV